MGPANPQDIFIVGETADEGEDADALSRQIDEIRKELDTMNQGHPRRADLMAQQHRLYQRMDGGRPL